MNTQLRNITATEAANVPKVDMKFEIAVIPVSDVDRCEGVLPAHRMEARRRLRRPGGDFRVIQFTPPGSGASVIFGKNVTAAAPGSAQGLYLIVSDIEAARQELVGHGVEVSEVFHGNAGTYIGPDEPYLFGRARVSGPDPEHSSYRSFASFKDPDGNGWLFQEVTARQPGRMDSERNDIFFGSRPGRRISPRRGCARRARETGRRRP